MLHHVGPQVVTDRIGVPAHAGEEVLHPVGRAVARRLRQLPAVLASHRREQPAQVGQRPPAWLDPPEPRGAPPGVAPPPRPGAGAAPPTRPGRAPSPRLHSRPSCSVLLPSRTSEPRL